MSPQFDDSDVLARLHAMQDSQLDALEYGVIAFDGDYVVKRYNLHETQATGLKQERVIGNQFFTEVAQCMNNYLVAQKFVDTRAAAGSLDETLDFVLTWRMRPTPVKLRLLSTTGIHLQYLLLKRIA
jgi:photoactive yellow protein